MPPAGMNPAPLDGRTVLVACSESKLPALVSGLETMGARVIPFPTIQIRELRDKALLDNALERLEEYSWILFTSTHGVLFFLLRMKQREIAVERLRGIKVCAVGPATARALGRAGIEVSLVPDDYLAEGIVRALKVYHGSHARLSGTRILLPRAREGRDILPRELEATGAEVDIVPCYENVLPKVDEKTLESIRRSEPDLLVFTSPSTVTNFVRLLGEIHSRNLLDNAIVAAVGPITAGTLKSFGKDTVLLPEESTMASLLLSIGRHFSGAEIDRT